VNRKRKPREMGRERGRRSKRERERKGKGPLRPMKIPPSTF